MAAGAAISVPSGVTIRCTGTFTNRGVILVDTGNAAWGISVGPGSLPIVAARIGPPALGIASVLPAVGDVGDDSIVRLGGMYGKGLLELQARAILHPGIQGGGSGAGFVNGGGGSFTVLAMGGIVNAAGASILAAGSRGTGVDVGGGGGGGGGGVLILASKTSVINAGTIDVSGGDGAPSNFASGFGGGGGGGIAHLLAPAITTAGGSIIVSGGKGGSNAVPISAPLRSGGNGGGGSGGNGGQGGEVPAGATVFSRSPLGSSGQPGYALQSLLDPTSLF